MAGSYGAVVQKDGNLAGKPRVVESLATGDDVFQCILEMYGMIWYLAGTHTPNIEKAVIDDARKNYRQGLKIAREVNG
jgi:hypothetical protein